MVFYDHKPTKTEPVGDGRYRYRWNIEEVPADEQGGMTGMDGDGQQEEQPAQQTQWRANEVIVPRLESNVITAAVIASVWDSSYEQKLVNEYNAANLGVYGEETAQKKITAYTDFLNARNALKSQVDSDCEELGIR